MSWRNVITGWKHPAALMFAALVMGCVGTSVPSELTRVMGQIGRGGIVNGPTSGNPLFEIIGDRSVRVTVWTIHECPFARSDARPLWDGNEVSVALWEIRGPCEGGGRTWDGKHEIILNFPDYGDAVIELQAQFRGYITTNRTRIELTPNTLSRSPVGGS